MNAMCSRGSRLAARSFVVTVVLAVVATGSSPALAEVRSGDVVVVRAGEVIDGNLYASGSTVAIRGDVRGDVVVAGGNVLVDGSVRGDVLAAGGQITLSGRVFGDVRAAGGQVSVLAPVGGDAVLAGGDIHLGGSVQGDALITGGTAALTSSIGGGVLSAASETRIASTVGGNVAVQGGRLSLGENARLGGDLDFTGPRAIERAPGAHVAGEITQRRAPGTGRPNVGAFFYGWLQVLTGLFALGLVLLFLFPRFSERATTMLERHPGKSAGFGAIALLGIPLAIGLVFAIGSVVGGAWLGLFGLALYGLALGLSVPLVAAFLGVALVRRLRGGRAPAAWWPMLLGLVVLTALYLVPFLGPLVALATLLFGLGALVLSWLGTLRATTRERSVGVAGAAPAFDA